MPFVLCWFQSYCLHTQEKYAGKKDDRSREPVVFPFIEILSKYGGRRGLFRALHRQADAATLLVDIQNGDLDDIAD